MQKFGFVYIWRDRKHSKYYIGSHWGHESDGYVCSSHYMIRAKTRRPDDFKRRILKKIYTNKKDLLLEEYKWLSLIKEDELGEKYYNLVNGTQNQWWSDDQKRLTIGQKISLNRKGKNTGPRDPEIGRKISAAKKGKKFTEEHCKSISQGKTGTKHSSESKEKQSESLREYYKTSVHHGIGKTHSEEHKLKISEGCKGRKLSVEQITFLKEKNSKKYVINYQNGESEIIKGLKAYSTSKNIPYVSLRKSLITKKPLQKYGISSITN